MAYVDFKKGYVRFKLVYYGPKDSGKTANLEYLSKLNSNNEEIVPLGNESDDAGCFEHLPLYLGRIRGVDTTLKMYTVPGQEQYNKTRQMVLKDADGIVFVIDSGAEQLDSNIASLKNLQENLSRHNISLFDLPVVIQYNKRDLQDALPIDTLQESLNPYSWPMVESSVPEGKNIKKTLTLITQLIYKQTASQYSLVPSSAPTPAMENAPEPEPAPEATTETIPKPPPSPKPAIASPPQPLPSPDLPSLPPFEAEDEPISGSDLEMLELEEGDLEEQAVGTKKAPPPPSKLSSNLVAHLIESVPPPPILRNSSAPASEADPAGAGRIGIDLEPLLYGMESRLLARMGILEAALQDLSKKHEEHETKHRQDGKPPEPEGGKELAQNIANLANNMNDLSAEFQMFQSSIDLLSRKLDQLTASNEEKA